MRRSGLTLVTDLPGLTDLQAEQSLMAMIANILMTFSAAVAGCGRLESWDTDAGYAIHLATAKMENGCGVYTQLAPLC